jgi:hypothetical protein
MTHPPVHPRSAVTADPESDAPEMDAELACHLDAQRKAVSADPRAADAEDEDEAAFLL